MTGDLLIDGADAYSKWRVYVTDQGYNGIISMPQLKSYESNDWHEYDGLEADLSAPALDKREGTVAFATSMGLGGYTSFIEALEDGAYHEVSFAKIGRTMKLRVLSHSGLTASGALWKFSVKFSNDFPLQDYEYSAPSGGITYGTLGCTMDGLELGSYGITLLEGTTAGAALSPAVKQNLARSIGGEAGVEYDGDGGVTLKSKEISLPCLMRNSSLEGLWQCYDALLYDLSRADAREIYFPAMLGRALCAYKSGEVTWFDARKACLKLTLKMTVLEYGGGDPLLLTEDGRPILTEAGEGILAI